CTRDQSSQWAYYSFHLW
nr:immunoglobulin heavy chain junction region [Macaca mulatta]MOV87346.1 immunoglobulin heavy chain junction region [Macaca mulatta]